MKTLDMQTTSSTRPISTQRNTCRKLSGCRSRLKASIDTKAVKFVQDSLEQQRGASPRCCNGEQRGHHHIPDSSGAHGVP